MDEVQIQVVAEPADLKGRFSNSISLSIQEREIILDFYCDVGSPKLVTRTLVSRIFLGHVGANNLKNLLIQSIATYQDRKYAPPSPTPPEKPQSQNPNPPK